MQQRITLEDLKRIAHLLTRRQIIRSLTKVEG